MFTWSLTGDLIFLYRLHTGGYSVIKRENEKYDFQIVHHYIDLTQLTLRRLPVSLR